MPFLVAIADLMHSSSIGTIGCCLAIYLSSHSVFHQFHVYCRLGRENTGVRDGVAVARITTLSSLVLQILFNEYKKRLVFSSPKIIGYP